jgi:transcriptional regulator with XRE-family HTH domain
MRLVFLPLRNGGAMPRPNRPRELYAELHVASRVAIEREARGWSYEGLADRLGKVGCPIQPSAIYKIEKARPPRRITVTELVAFSKVFMLSVEELLVDPATRLSAAAIRLVERFQAIQREYAEAKLREVELHKESEAVLVQLQELAKDSAAVRAIREQVRTTFSEQGTDYQRDLLGHITGEDDDE